MATRAQNLMKMYDISRGFVKPSFSYRLLIIVEPMWAIDLPRVNTELGRYPKNETPDSMYKALFRQVLETEYEGYKIIYTGGSKDDAGVGAAAVCGDNIRTTTLPNHASIYTAEMCAIKLAFDIAEDIDEERILICSDSRSALSRLEVLREDGHIIRQFQHCVYTQAKWMRDSFVEYRDTQT